MYHSIFLDEPDGMHHFDGAGSHIGKKSMVCVIINCLSVTRKN